MYIHIAIYITQHCRHCHVYTYFLYICVNIAGIVCIHIYICIYIFLYISLNIAGIAKFFKTYRFNPLCEWIGLLPFEHRFIRVCILYKYVYIYMYMYAYMCVQNHVRIHFLCSRFILVCIVYKYVYIYMYMYAYKCVQNYVRIHFLCVWACLIYIYRYVYVSVILHTHIQIHIHSYIKFHFKFSIHTHRHTHTYIHIINTYLHKYGVATISRLLKIIGLLCKKAL